MLRTWVQNYAKMAFLDLEGVLLSLKGEILHNVLESGGPWPLWHFGYYIPASGEFLQDS